MKNCPRCSFLMDDHESVCSTCAEQVRNEIPLVDEPVVAPPQHGGTAVLERPTVVPLSETATFRTASSNGVSVPVVVIGAVLAALLTVGVVMGLRHEGPLAAPLEQIGLIEPSGVSVPSSWGSLSSAAGGFGVQMPAGVTDVAEDPELAASGLVGYTVQLGDDASMMAVSTDLGRGPAGMAEMDSDAGFSSLIDWYVGIAGLGQETVRRDARVSHGRAADSVLVLDDTHTTRVRLMLVDDRLVVLQTSGPDTGASALDEAHSRLINSYDPI